MNKENKRLLEANIEKFKNIWYSRMPSHEINADTGEDMFWGTAELVAREYASQFKDQQVGAVWVKASEFVKRDNKPECVFGKRTVKGECYRHTFRFDDLRQVLRDLETEGIYMYYRDEEMSNVYILDEQSQPILSIPSDGDKFVSMEEYNHALNKIDQLQGQLLEAEEEILNLNDRLSEA